MANQSDGEYPAYPVEDPGNFELDDQSSSSDANGDSSGRLPCALPSTSYRIAFCCAKLHRAPRSCALDDPEAHPTKRVLCERKRVTGQPTSSSNPVQAQLNPLSQEYSGLS